MSVIDSRFVKVVVLVGLRMGILFVEKSIDDDRPTGVDHV